MTADYFPFPRELPGHAGTRITDEVRGINRVVCDITSLRKKCQESDHVQNLAQRARLTRGEILTSFLAV